MRHRKFFLVTDVHGFFDKMKETLDAAGFDQSNPDHVFISCGDLLDRGPQPRECLEFLMGLDPDRRAFVTGNHEILLAEALVRGSFLEHDFHNGTAQTAFDLSGKSPYNQLEVCNTLFHNELLISYLNECVDFIETETAICVHGYIPVTNDKTYNPNWREASDEDWEAARWLNGMEMWSKGIREEEKTIYCGHWHCSWGHAKLHHYGSEFPNKYSTNPDHQVAHFSPFVDDGIVAFDACTAFSHKLNVISFEE